MYNCNYIYYMNNHLSCHKYFQNCMILQCVVYFDIDIQCCMNLSIIEL